MQEVFDKLTGIISDSDMARMNYEVETEGREPRDVAEDFLREQRSSASEEVASMKTDDCVSACEEGLWRKDRSREIFACPSRKGEFVTIIGSSGCGKTTALKMVNGLLTPDQGEILVNGEDIRGKDQTQLRQEYRLRDSGQRAVSPYDGGAEHCLCPESPQSEKQGKDPEGCQTNGWRSWGWTRS